MPNTVVFSRNKIAYLLFSIGTGWSLTTGCVKSYNPPATQVNYRYLAIDGVLINSADSPSVFALSRTVRLTDTTTASVPETGARVSVEGKSGVVYSFTELPGGMYKSTPLLLNISDQFRLKITTSDGENYASDFVAVKQAPPIDSITWTQPGDVQISANTHDPGNNTHYYRWNYTETWQYTAPEQSELGVKDGIMFYVEVDTADQKYNCWSTDYSTNILVGTSVALQQDIISHAPIAVVPQNSVKISVRYSINVNQYALTPEAYQYFQVLQKNTENLGSIFDAQPTQLTGNIHSLSRPSEVVIGYFSASSVQQARIFIGKHDVANWHYLYPGQECNPIQTTAGSPTNLYLYTYPDSAYTAYYFCGTGCIFVDRVSCLDCTVQGGINKRPSFW